MGRPFGWSDGLPGNVVDDYGVPSAAIVDTRAWGVFRKLEVRADGLPKCRHQPEEVKMTSRDTPLDNARPTGE